MRQPFPVLHDYPEWMYQGHIAWSLISGAPDFVSSYELVLVPVPNAISHIFIALLNSVVSPVVAGQIWLGVYLLLSLVVVFVSARRYRMPAAVQLIFLFTIAFGPGFFNGYINFQFGVLFFALFIVTESWRSVTRLLLFSLLIYFSHASVFAGFVIYMCVSEILNQRRFSVAVALLPSLLMLAWYAVVKILGEESYNTSVGSLSQWVQYKIYTLAKQGPFHNFILADGQSLLADAHWLYIAGFIVNFLVAVLIGGWLLSVAWRFLSRRELAGSDRALQALFTTVVVLLVMWLLAGVNTFGVVNLGERFLIVALMLLLLRVEIPRWPVVGWSAACALAGTVTIASLLILSKNTQSYTVDRSADSTELSSFVDDIYSNSRHNYFNHRIFIYANLGQYLLDPEKFESPLPVDHESSIVRMIKDQ